MKAQIFQKPAMAVMLAMLALSVPAQDSSNPSVNATTVASQTAPQLSYGVPQILQMSQAKVSDGTIITYIQNSGTIYALNASQIVYLKRQGVSDAVLNAMLNQRNQVAATASQQNYPESNNIQTPNAVAQPTVTYVENVPSSSVYVVPDTQTYDYYSYYYHPYYPYYGYYGWPYPAVTFSFGFGHGFRGGGFHGGFHGHWHR